jgi:hypothetical protein
MEVLQPEGGLANDFAGFRHRQSAVPPDEHFQVGAVDELQDEKRAVRNPPGVIRCDQVGVPQSGGQDPLLTESRDNRLIACQPRVDHLDGHQALRAQLARLVDSSHTAASQHPEDLEAGKGEPVGHPRICCQTVLAAQHRTAGTPRSALIGGQ